MDCTFDIRDSVLHARLRGQFIFSDHTAFKPLLEQVTSQHVSHMRIDVSGVHFIDSAGLGMLLLLRDICDKHTKKLTLVKPTGQAKKVFDLSRFEHLFTIEE